MGPNKLEDELSLESLRKNDSAAWAQAYDQLWKVAWRSVRKVMPHATDSELEELAATVLTGRGKVVEQIINPSQPSFVKAKRFSDILNLTAAKAHGMAVDEVRKHVRREKESTVEQVGQLYRTPIDPSDEAQQRERCEFLTIAIAGLEDRYREVIGDYYFEKMKTRKIAEKRGRPHGAVCTDLVKARKLLGDLLGDL